MKSSKKKRTRLYLLGLSAMTVACVSALVGSTFAWVIANRTASGTVGNIGVHTDGTLEVSTNGTTWSDQFSLNMAQYPITGSSVSLTDISGNGLAFYKPLIAASDGQGIPTFTEVHTITPGSTTVEKYYFDINLQFRSKDPLTVFLNETTTVTGGVNDFNKAIRTAFLNGTGTEVTNIFTERTETLYYMNNNTATSGEIKGSSGSLNSGYSDTFTAGTTVLQGDVTKRDLVGTDKAGSSKALVKLARGNVNDEYCVGSIIVRYWFEGTDEACIMANVETPVQMTLGFDGLAESI